jgi:hypothetical protein
VNLAIAHLKRRTTRHGHRILNAALDQGEGIDLPLDNDQRLGGIDMVNAEEVVRSEPPF